MRIILKNSLTCWFFSLGLYVTKNKRDVVAEIQIKNVSNFFFLLYFHLFDSSEKLITFYHFTCAFIQLENSDVSASTHRQRIFPHHTIFFPFQSTESTTNSNEKWRRQRRFMLFACLCRKIHTFYHKFFLSFFDYQ